MKSEDKKYERVLNLLRNSKPVLTEAESITEKVMRQLQEEKSKITFPELLLDFVFGWVNIEWVRKSMVTAVLAIAVLFIYQNAQIIRQMKDLSGQRIQNGSVVMTNLRDDLIDQLRIFKHTGKSISDEKITVSEKEIDEMIKSLNDLKVKYKDIFNLIENDPHLKKYFDEKINENKKSKI